MTGLAFNKAIFAHRRHARRIALRLPGLRRSRTPGQQRRQTIAQRLHKLPAIPPGGLGKRPVLVLEHVDRIQEIVFVLTGIEVAQGHRHGVRPGMRAEEVRHLDPLDEGPAQVRWADQQDAKARLRHALADLPLIVLARQDAAVVVKAPHHHRLGTAQAQVLIHKFHELRRKLAIRDGEAHEHARGPGARLNDCKLPAQRDPGISSARIERQRGALEIAEVLRHVLSACIRADESQIKAGRPRLGDQRVLEILPHGAQRVGSDAWEDTEADFFRGDFRSLLLRHELPQPAQPGDETGVFDPGVALQQDVEQGKGIVEVQFHGRRVVSDVMRAASSRPRSHAGMSVTTSSRRPRASLAMTR